MRDTSPECQGIDWRLQLLLCAATGYNLASLCASRGDRKVFLEVVLLILESLGSTELIFILIMALVFFGPRKLPQLSRTIGKNVATFRRASEDFKRTWDREVSMEELNFTRVEPDHQRVFADNSILDNAQVGQPMQPPTIEAVPAERVIARGSVESETTETYDESAPSSKRDWL